MFPSITDVEERLKQFFIPDRYEHSLGVRDTTLKLAGNLGYSNEYLEYAALLHDCGKIIPDREIVEYACKNDIDIDEDIKLIGAPLYHCVVGLKLVNSLFNINHAGVNEAIRYHAIGHVNMVLSTKIIYVADLIEPNRQFHGIDELRKIVFRSFADGLVEVAKNKLKYLLNRNALIHPSSIPFWNQVLSQREKDK